MPAARPTRAAPAVSNEVLSEQVRAIDGRINGIDSTLRTVADSLTAFVRLEERHAALIKQVEAVVEELGEHSKRLDSIDIKIPPLVETRKWIISGTLGIVALVGIGIYNGYLSLRNDTRAVVSQQQSLPRMDP